MHILAFTGELWRIHAVFPQKVIMVIFRNSSLLSKLKLTPSQHTKCKLKTSSKARAGSDFKFLCTWNPQFIAKQLQKSWWNMKQQLHPNQSQHPSRCLPCIAPRRSVLDLPPGVHLPRSSRCRLSGTWTYPTCLGRCWKVAAWLCGKVWGYRCCL